MIRHTEARLLALLLAWPLAACSDHSATSHRDPDAGHAPVDGGRGSQHGDAGDRTHDSTAHSDAGTSSTASDASTATGDAAMTAPPASDGGALDAGTSAPDAGKPVCEDIRVTPDSKDPCVFALSTMIDGDRACTGTIMLNAEILPCANDDGWLIADASHIVLSGAACQAAMKSADVLVTARFPCNVRLDCACENGSAPSARPSCVDALPDGKACTTPDSHCGGPCSNSWQADHVCLNGTWQPATVVACGSASDAPQCRNSFSGGQLTPCCPEAKLDCSGKPDGWPGFGCTPGQDSFCSCTCQGGQQVCGC